MSNWKAKHNAKDSHVWYCMWPRTLETASLRKQESKKNVSFFFSFLNLKYCASYPQQILTASAPTFTLKVWAALSTKSLRSKMQDTLHLLFLPAIFIWKQLFFSNLWDSLLQSGMEKLEAEQESNLRESEKQTIKDICNKGKQSYSARSLLRAEDFAISNVTEQIYDFTIKLHDTI